jgi:hypothetical protein
MRDSGVRAHIESPVDEEDTRHERAGTAIP